MSIQEFVAAKQSLAKTGQGFHLGIVVCFGWLVFSLGVLAVLRHWQDAKMVCLLGNECQRLFDFQMARLSAVNPAPGALNLLSETQGGSISHPLGKVAGLRSDECTVHQHERLRGDCRRSAAFAVRSHRREIERIENRQWTTAAVLDVNSAAKFSAVHRDHRARSARIGTSGQLAKCKVQLQEVVSESALPWWLLK